MKVGIIREKVYNVAWKVTVAIFYKLYMFIPVGDIYFDTHNYYIRCARFGDKLWCIGFM